DGQVVQARGLGQVNDQLVVQIAIRERNTVELQAGACLELFAQVFQRVRCIGYIRERDLLAVQVGQCSCRCASWCRGRGGWCGSGSCCWSSRLWWHRSLSWSSSGCLSRRWGGGGCAGGEQRAGTGDERCSNQAPPRQSRVTRTVHASQSPRTSVCRH